jgi:predicted LPLAT superfamily acyltransferase
MADGRQWQGKTKGGKFGQRFLLSFLKRFRVTALYPSLPFIIPFCLIFARKPNRALYRYFHDIHRYGRWRALRSTARNAYNFGKVVIDKFAIWAGRSDQFSVRVEQPEIPQRLFEQEKGVLFAGSHIGNFELLATAFEKNPKKINVIIYGGESEMLNQQRTSVFGENHVNLIPVTADMSHLFTIKNALENGEVVAILCDRLFGSPKKKTLDFLGHPADFPIGPFRLAAQMDVPVLSVAVMKEKGLCYSCHTTLLNVEPSLTTSQKCDILIEQYVKSLENVLLQYPEQWFNLYDFWNLENNHNRK